MGVTYYRENGLVKINYVYKTPETKNTGVRHDSQRYLPFLENCLKLGKLYA